MVGICYIEPSDNPGENYTVLVPWHCIKYKCDKSSSRLFVGQNSCGWCCLEKSQVKQNLTVWSLPLWPAGINTRPWSCHFSGYEAFQQGRSLWTNVFWLNYLYCCLYGLVCREIQFLSTECCFKVFCWKDLRIYSCVTWTMCQVVVGN